MDDSRQALVPLLKEFEKDHWNSAKDNTILFRLLVEDYTKHGSDFEFETNGAKLLSYKSIFKSLDKGYRSLPMETIEDLKAIHDLYKTLDIEESLSSGMRIRSLYEGLFNKPGWAKEHNDWFVEAIKGLGRLTLTLFSIDEKKLSTEEECQILFLENILGELKSTREYGAILKQLIKREERLWTAFEKSVFTSSSVQDDHFSLAGELLNGKPFIDHEEEYKNILSKLFRGDHSILKPWIACYFESNVWPEQWQKSLRELCASSLGSQKSKYYQEIKQLVMTSPSLVFTKYFTKCSNCTEDVTEHAIKHFDYSGSVGKSLYSKLRCNDKLESKFLDNAPIEGIRGYFHANNNPESMMSQLQRMDEEGLHERVSEILYTGDFADWRFYNARRIDDNYFGFSEDSICSKNIDRLNRFLPSGKLSVTQAIMSLILDKRIPSNVRRFITRRLYISEPADYDTENGWREKLGLKDDFSSSLSEALKDFKLQAIMDDRNLIQTIVYYLVGKIDRDDAEGELCPQVMLAVCLLTSRRLD